MSVTLAFRAARWNARRSSGCARNRRASVFALALISIGGGFRLNKSLSSPEQPSAGLRIFYSSQICCQYKRPCSIGTEQAESLTDETPAKRKRRIGNASVPPHATLESPDQLGSVPTYELKSLADACRNSRNLVARMKRRLIVCRSLDRFQLPKTKSLRQIAESIPPLSTRYLQHRTQ
jgi:hypothetical protein